MNRDNDLDGESEEYYDDEDEDEYDDSDVPTENEDDPISTDEDTDDSEEEIQDKPTVKNTKKSSNSGVQLVTTEKTDTNIKKDEVDLLAVLKSLQDKGENTGLVSECIKLCNQKMLVNKKKEQKKLQKEK